MKWMIIFLITLMGYAFVTGDTGGARENAAKYQTIFKKTLQKADK